MRVCVVQNKVYKRISDTLKQIDDLIRNVSTSFDLLVLPEMFTTPYDVAYFEEYAQEKNGEVMTFLRKLAIKYNTFIVGGSVPFKEDNKLMNRLFVINQKGDIIKSYDKIHLFEITYPDGSSFDEADVLTAGDTPVTFEMLGIKIGVMICFDIRFPYLAETLMEDGAKLIVVPGAFNSYTGPLHWRTTFESRAIDNQLYMIGCSPCSNSYGSYQTYGHSIVVDPFGKVLNELDDKEGIFVIDIDLDTVEKARNTIPIIKNRKQIKR